ncbi:MAG TPA: tetratricopeptide repeat protein, partial [Chthoniobacteraceae bacterium]|nr:tetratricopeptide repeat protein [Chthoniobacteraceae bacterium]
PDDPAARLARARAYANSGDKDKAIADYTELLRRQPANPDLLEARHALYKASGDDAKAAADHTEAIRIMFSPDATVDSEWAHLKAAEAERTGDMQMALAAWSAVIKNNPDSLNARLARGGDYLTAGDADKAIADFTEALRLDTNNINAMQFRGDAFMRKGDFAKAAEDYSALIAAQPGSNAARDFRAAAYLKSGDADKALADAEQALALVAGDKEAGVLRGSALAAKGSYDKALEVLNKLIAAQPDYAPALNAAAQLLATCPDANFRDPAKALALAQKACELSQWKDAECIDTLAAAEAAGGDWENAVKHEKQAADAAKTAGVYESLTKDYLSRAEAYGQKKAAPPAKNPVQ